MEIVQPDVPHRRIGSQAVTTGKQQPYDQSPKGKGLTSQSGNLYGKKSGIVADNSSTSVGNTTEEVR